MKRLTGVVLALATLVILIASGVIPVGAQGGTSIPTMVNYQGYLETSGDPVTQDNVPMVFALYETISGGSSVWSESQDIDVSNGIFNVMLGGGGSPLTTDELDGERYLGVAVNGDPEMTPRQRLTSVAYAFWADTANSAYTLDAPDGDPIDAVYVDNDGNVGIGTTNPNPSKGTNGYLDVKDIYLRDSSNWASAGINEGIAIEMGSIADGEQIPLPHFSDSGTASQSNCSWIVSLKRSTDVNWGRHEEAITCIDCYADSNRNVVCKTYHPDKGGWKPATANYIIIGNR